MTRGKYAVKSAKTRAETAGQRADHLKQDLDAERKNHAGEVAVLKARIEALSAQLTGSIADLADDRVRRAEADCAELVRAVREEYRQAGLEVFRRIARAIVLHVPSNTWHIPGDAVPELVGELALLLGIPAGEAQEAGAREAGVATDRAMRRQDAKRHKAAVTGQPYVVLRGQR